MTWVKSEHDSWAFALTLKPDIWKVSTLLIQKRVQNIRREKKNVCNKLTKICDSSIVLDSEKKMRKLLS